MRRFILTAVAVATVAIVLATVTEGLDLTLKASPQSKSGAAVAYAKASIGAGSLLSFGGKGTTSAFITDADQTGFVEVTFNGKFPKGLTVDQVIPTATADIGNFAVANALVEIANSTQIVVFASCWRSTTGAPLTNNVSFAVYLGR
jgi:hypothetical protein